MKNILLFLISALLVNCKVLPTANNAARHSRYSLVYYQRTKADIPPIIVGEVSATQEKANPVLDTFLLDGQRLALNEADRANKYVLSVSPEIHRLQLVTITYRTVEASFRVKPGDSLRIDFQLQLEKRPLYQRTMNCSPTLTWLACALPFALAGASPTQAVEAPASYQVTFFRRQHPAAQPIITGTLYDSPTKKPLATPAMVVLNRHKLRTNAAGQFQAEVQPRTYQLTARNIFYKNRPAQQLKVATGDSLVVTFYLVGEGTVN